MPPHGPFLSDQRGFTGAEKALLLCFALAIIALGGALVRGGSGKAGGDAKATLEAGLGAAGGGPVGSLGGAGGLPSAVEGGSGGVTQQPQVPAGPQPLPEGRPDTAYDGMFVGADGRAYPRSTPLDEVPPAVSRSGNDNGELVVYVNGIGNDKATQHADMQAIADATGYRVVGIHNSTEGMNLPIGNISVRDLIQCIKDKYDLGTNHAVDQLADTIYDRIRQGKTIHVMGHSQGALITSRALQDVKNRLMVEDGLSEEEAERRMGLIRVETFGGAASRYPDGPQYVHYVNRLDPVPSAVGLGPTERSIDVPVTPLGPFGPKIEVPSIIVGESNEGAGDGARVHRFNDTSGVHDLTTYLRHRKSWSEGRR